MAEDLVVARFVSIKYISKITKVKGDSEYFDQDEEFVTMHKSEERYNKILQVVPEQEVNHGVSARKALWIPLGYKDTIDTGYITKDMLSKPFPLVFQGIPDAHDDITTAETIVLWQTTPYHPQALWNSTREKRARED